MENIFCISVEDVQSIALERVGRKLTIEELEQIQKGVEFGLELSWDVVVKTAIDEITENQLIVELLEWIAIRGAQDNTINIRTFIAIPYNPYEPEPYQRWTLQGLFDLENEIMVADEFWNFLGGENTYEQLLNVFEAVGIELRPEIDARFQEFNR